MRRMLEAWAAPMLVALLNGCSPDRCLVDLLLKVACALLRTC